MKIALGSDHGGYQLKENLKKYLKELKVEYQDFGCNSENPVDYPDVGFKIATEVKNRNYDKGILICGTGIGMSIVANKIKGIRASLCHDVFSARYAREHNDANILTLGGRVIGSGLAKEIVKVWLNTDFSGEERHLKRLNKIKQEEDKIYK
ncbi:MAG: ribose 5-phosphate isomerase B [Candidatus Infernicultor aquiphilus]|uniref:Ribose 5-phosphate isomerase B n=1 Tax=Candidatus Infernicultor aquiphilus TaxID=1805029 RepID=A0A1J5GDA5_9BACT|nr:MAG: ribose 5-phosphate isomerase B [Candidatus Atribacteria bacterium CG2_30_33_13]PIW11556.1 MAG: ribose 5-phosphate isomerase B [Candidatus Atribacteria bacterium CG17_big_fil_post_rev_8_21_14_2_50_34_11]